MRLTDIDRNTHYQTDRPMQREKADQKEKQKRKEKETGAKNTHIKVL